MLECLLCGGRRPWDPFRYLCPDCREPMVFARGERRRNFHGGKTRSLEIFLDFLPLEAVDPRLDLGEGGTPLVALDGLAAELGIAHLYAKCEMLNPTASFKDRGTAVAVQKAAALGIHKIGTVSTGNMAASTAAYGARAGVETTILVKEDTPLQGLAAAGLHGPRLVRVHGDYGGLFDLSLEIGRDSGIWFMNSVDPVRLEGYKLEGFEIFRQLGDRVPDFIVVPVSSGGHFLGLVRSFEDLVAGGFAERVPTFVGIQAAGCAPLASAFDAGLPRFVRLDKARTIAHAISNPAPPSGNSVLKLVRAHGGVLIAVGDPGILEAQRRLAAREGLFVQPESAAVLAGFARLVGDGRLRPGVTAVLVLTGCGLKAPRALENQPIRIEEAGLADLRTILAC